MDERESSHAPLPTVGRIVHYRMSEFDVGSVRTLPGFDSRRCNSPVVGQVYAALVVAAWPGDSACNLVVFLDGSATYWATSRTPGDADGCWSWPPRA